MLTQTMVGEKQVIELIPAGSEGSHSGKRVAIHTGQVWGGEERGKGAYSKKVEGNFKYTKYLIYENSGIPIVPA